MSTLIQVTQEDIELAREEAEQEALEEHTSKVYYAQGDRCPVYYAASRALKTEHIHVTKDAIQKIGEPYRSSWFSLPKIARDAIDKYDDTGEMEPFEFEVRN